VLLEFGVVLVLVKAGGTFSVGEDFVDVREPVDDLLGRCAVETTGTFPVFMADGA